METGNVVEYIDQQKIICAVVLEVKQQRLRLLTENNREVNLAQRRLSHKCKLRLNISMGRDKIVETLKTVAQRRNALVRNIDIRALWEVLNTEQEWIDLGTMTRLCFPDDATYDHEAAVARALFNNRRYFKFNYDRFFPNTQEAVKRRADQEKKDEKKRRLIESGVKWLRNILKGNTASVTGPGSNEREKLVNILKSCYLFEKESETYLIAKAMLESAKIDPDKGLFNLLVKLGKFKEDENLDLYRMEIPTVFSDPVHKSTERLLSLPISDSSDAQRKDFTMLPAMTIDGQATMDYDDAISIEDYNDYYRLGIHIADVGHIIKKGDTVDLDAVKRGSSIYMPDLKIPMIPSLLAEDLCSLKAGQLRPAISIMVDLDQSCEMIDFSISPSMIKVKNQFTYFDVNLMADENPDIITLCRIAEKFRNNRFASGALQITLPDINVWINEDGEVTVNRVNRESPGRMLVSEIMIMANWLMARFLADNNRAAIYRSQPDPKERLYKDNEGSLFQNYMQRKLINRFVLGNSPERHSGLGLNWYVTATSPIRKYFDLATQRQIRSVFGLEEPYTPKEIDRLIQSLEQPMGCVARVQHNRHRYWLLKYLENRTGKKENAVVLYKKRNTYQVLIPEYMIECSMPVSGGINLKPEDLVQVTIQHVNARNNVFSIFLS